MKGHVEQRRPGSWTIVIEVGSDPVTGKRKRHLKTIRGTKREAEREMVALLAELDKKPWTQARNLRLSEAVEQWFADHTHIRKNTVRGYRAAIKHVLELIGNVMVRDLTPEHIESAYRTLKREKGLTRQLALADSVLRQVMRAALKRSPNPMDDVALPKFNGHENRAFTPDELKRILKSREGHPDGVLIETLVSTGARRGEALAWEWTDIDFERQVATISKTLLEDSDTGRLELGPPKSKASNRTINLGWRTIQRLRAHKKAQEEHRRRMGTAWVDKNLVFPTETGDYQRPSAVSNRFSYLLRQLGIRNANLHCLRHTYTTYALQRGENPKVVQAHIGDSTPDMVMKIYAHILPGAPTQSAERQDDMLARALDEESSVANIYS